MHIGRCPPVVTPTFHPILVNGRLGDPALFVTMLHRREAILFDMGDLSALSPRDLLRVGHVFVSHMHMDHFIGFDLLMRLLVGRDRLVRIAGPPGLCDRLHHKLQGYEWDLADRYEADLVFDALDIGGAGPQRAARFRFRNRFGREDLALEPGHWMSGDGFAVEASALEHHGLCLGFALTEPAHANVWKNRLEQRGLEAGAWLQALKQAIVAGAPDEQPIALPGGATLPLEDLRDLVTLTPGQKIAYVTDVADTPGNRSAIATLAKGADTLFLESRFAAEHAEQARQRAHLTTIAAGEIARLAAVRRFEPFHFSARYEGDEERLIGEALSAFQKEDVPRAERLAT